MVSNHGGLHHIVASRLIRGAHSHELFLNLTNQSIRSAEQAYLRRDLEVLEDTSPILMNLPVDAARQIGLYYRALDLILNAAMKRRHRYPRSPNYCCYFAGFLLPVSLRHSCSRIPPSKEEARLPLRQIIAGTITEMISAVDSEAKTASQARNLVHKKKTRANIKNSAPGSPGTESLGSSVGRALRFPISPGSHMQPGVPQSHQPPTVLWPAIATVTDGLGLVALPL